MVRAQTKRFPDGCGVVQKCEILSHKLRREAGKVLFLCHWSQPFVHSSRLLPEVAVLALVHSWCCYWLIKTVKFPSFLAALFCFEAHLALRVGELNIMHFLIRVFVAEGIRPRVQTKNCCILMTTC